MTRALKSGNIVATGPFRDGLTTACVLYGGTRAFDFPSAWAFNFFEIPTSETLLSSDWRTELCTCRA